jgi:hypothetical protein
MRIASRVVLVIVAGVVLTLAARAAEKKINRSDLPPAVEKTVAAQSSGAVVRGFSQEVEKGQTFYEAELTVDGHSKDILMDATGAIVEVEEEVSMDHLPAGVQAALKTAAGKGKIGKIESLTKHDRLVAYEAHVSTDGKKSEVQVGPDGKPLDHEE